MPSRFALVLLLGLTACADAAHRALLRGIGRQGFFFGPNSETFPVQVLKTAPQRFLHRRVVAISYDGPRPYLVWYFDQQGRALPGCPYQLDSEEFHGRWAIVQKHDSLGVIDREGRLLVPYRYREIRYTRHPAGWLWVRSGRKWALVDSLGRAQTAAIYEDTRDFSNGMAGVQRARRWGFVDLHGREQIAPTYEDVWQDFHEGFAALRDSATHRVGIINKHNRPITAFKYRPVHSYSVHFRGDSYYYDFQHGYAIIRDDSLHYGVLDTLGREVLPVRFDGVQVTDSALIGRRGTEHSTPSGGARRVANAPAPAARYRPQ